LKLFFSGGIQKEKGRRLSDGRTWDDIGVFVGTERVMDSHANMHLLQIIMFSPILLTRTST
jgi:hypothetical protein